MILELSRHANGLQALSKGWARRQAGWTGPGRSVVFWGRSGLRLTS